MHNSKIIRTFASDKISYSLLIVRVMAKNITKSDLVQLLASTNAEEITVKQFGECKMKKD